MVKVFRPHIGRQRVGSSIGAPTRANTFAARAAMQDIINNFDEFVKHMEDVTPEILMKAVQPTFDKSQKYVPKDTGALKKSGYLEIGKFRGVSTLEIGYGAGGKPDYAATVHENLEFFHKAPTKAKYLQSALEEDGVAIQNRIIFLLKEASGI